MARKLPRIICVILLCITICSVAKEPMCQEKIAQEQQNTEDLVRQNDAEQERPDVEKVYNIFNQKKMLFQVYYKQDPSTMQEIYNHAEDVQGNFEPVVNGDSIFPEELVVLLEGAFHHSNNIQLWEEESVYHDTIRGLGAEDYVLGLEEIYELFPQVVNVREQVQYESEVYGLLTEMYGLPYHCETIFHINLSENQDNYVFVYQSGGSNGFLSVKLTERSGDSFVELSEFEVLNYGYGRVIQYEDVFYYVFLQRNYNLKEYDGVRIYRLGPDAEQENLLIRYLPEYYASHAVEIQNGNMDSEMEKYIDSVLRNIEDVDAGYLDSGYEKTKNGVDRYRGDEQKVEINVQNLSYCDKIDIANTGVPVYIANYLYTPSDVRSMENIKAYFYLYDEESGTLKELYDLTTDDPYIKLLQLWFKKFGDVVYTFRIYHVFDYNYVMNVSVLEGDILTEKGTYIISPKREFILTEGEIVKLGRG